MEQLLVVMLLLAATIIAAYFYLKRAQQREADASPMEATPDHPADETAPPSETGRP